MNKAFRLSKLQKNTLFILYALQQRGKRDPIPGVDILAMINKGRELKVFPPNFRASCHTLVANQLIRKYRSDSLQLAFTLTEAGQEPAEREYKERVKQM
ncbi:MAG: chromosome segregation protein ParM [Pararheinheimera sp.]|nr:chromosome segregation protein ParM [Rheinheimera sp.]